MRAYHLAGRISAIAFAIVCLAGLPAAAEDDPFAPRSTGDPRAIQPPPEGGVVAGPMLTGQADSAQEGGGDAAEEAKEVPFCEVVVVSPDGDPVDGANVLLTRRNIALVLEDNVPVPSYGLLVRLTERGGKFVLPLVENHGYVFALHATGCAEQPMQDVFDARRLELQPYGRVEGVAYVGDEPGAELDVALSYDVIPPRGTGRVHPIYRTVTDAEGRFVFGNAPPGMGRVAIEYASPWGQRQLSHPRPVDIVPGEAVEAALGGTGRPVVGRIEAPDDPQSQRPWAIEHASIVPLERVTVADAKRDLEKYRNRQSYYIAAEADGAFRAEDIEAGAYRLVARIRESIDGSPVKGRVMGKLEHVFTVPEMPEGRDDAPLDLGALTFEAVRIVEKAWR